MEHQKFQRNEDYMSLQIINEGFKKRYMNEATTELSTVDDSVSSAIANWWSDYDFFEKPVKQIYSDLVAIIPENRKNEPKVKRLLTNIQRCRDYTSAASAIQEFVLKGENLGQLRGFKEVDRKFMKNFGHKR